MISADNTGDRRWDDRGTPMVWVKSVLYTVITILAAGVLFFTGTYLESYERGLTLDRQTVQTTQNTELLQQICKSTVERDSQQFVITKARDAIFVKYSKQLPKGFAADMNALSDARTVGIQAYDYKQCALKPPSP